MTPIPSTTWRTLAQRSRGEKLPDGLDSIWDRGLGRIHSLLPRTGMFLRRARKVIALESQFAELAESKLREEITRCWETWRRGRETRGDQIRAVALIREAAFRTIGLRAYPVQLAGGFAMAGGCIAEMATGEGKTLTAVMPTVLAGWRGRGCHVITVNDYLAKRDAEIMKPVYEYCGLTVAHIDGEMDPAARREAYQADVTYLTNKDAAADFLRDRLALGRKASLPSALMDRLVHGAGTGTDQLVQRGLNYALIDEADSVLIDEAVTPLIISGPAPNAQQVETFQQAARLAGKLRHGRDYRVSHRYREIHITSAGIYRLMNLSRKIGGLWHGQRRAVELVTQALTARYFYLHEKQYVIQDDKVVIVDESTGRLMPDREWRDGLHQAVTAKEGLEIEPPKETHARISFQRFFGLYRQLSGMTGTAAEAGPEFWQMYHLPVAVIPTNKPRIRKEHPDRVFATEPARTDAIIEEILRIHAQDRPILIGTRNVQTSETLSRLLTEQHLDHQVLNAIRHKEEADIVARAGQPKAITVATNMAGRGTDIKLGQGVAQKGGLHVIAVERNLSRRIDRQLFGRAGRQGDPGSSQTFASLQDELPGQYLPNLTTAMRRRFGQTRREITSPITRKLFTLAQKTARRQALEQRKSVRATDDWLDEYLGFAGKEN